MGLRLRRRIDRMIRIEGERSRVDSKRYDSQSPAKVGMQGCKSVIMNPSRFWFRGN